MWLSSWSWIHRQPQSHCLNNQIHRLRLDQINSLSYIIFQNTPIILCSMKWTSSVTQISGGSRERREMKVMMGEERDKGEKTAEWLMDGGCITDERRKTDRARPMLEAQQSDKQRRRHKSERRVMKTSTQEREEMLDCLHLLSLARWPSGRQDDGHMNQTLSAWKRVEDENAACQSSLTWPALFHQRKDEESHKEEDAKTYSWPKWQNGLKWKTTKRWQRRGGKGERWKE